MPTIIITDARTGEVTERKMTPEEIENLAPTSNQARAYRNNLLAASDWTQSPDAPVNIEAWKEYRQALRDITKQGGFPMNIKWPEVPS